MGLSKVSQKGTLLLKVVFCTLVGTFIVIISSIFFPTFREFTIPLMIFSATAFFLSGLVLIFLTLKLKVKGSLKKFLLLTGASATGFFISVLLHNILYGLFIVMFGEDFWDRIGVGDEPLFFLIAIFVCPIGFLVGVVGSIVQFIKRKTS